MQTNSALPTNDKKTASGENAVFVLPEFKVSGVFGSHMVLQRKRPVKIWGFSDAEGSEVTGELDGEKASAKVKNGVFTLTFSAREASFDPIVMRIYDGRGHETVFDDILIGDVWMIGGQSNAELNLRFVLPQTLPEKFDDNGAYRLFMQTQAYPYTHQELCASPQPDVICPDWSWKLPDSEASLSFSALGWFFAEKLCKTADVPVGAINISAGGACIRELVPAALAAEMGYDYGANVCQCGYYNTLIHPFEGLQFYGMVFFQGESEGGSRELAERYDKELERLVRDERERFGFDFPFYNVQLCSYRAEGKQYFPFLETVRMKQFDAKYEIKNSYLSVAMDLGSPADWGDFAHSPKKKALTDRITDLVLAKEYGVGSFEEASSPEPVEAVLSGGAVVIKFRYATGGLSSRNGDTVNGFSFGGFDDLIPAEARITAPDTAEVAVPEGACTEYINYAYISDVNENNAGLYKSNGLPCPAFRIKVLKET